MRYDLTFLKKKNNANMGPNINTLQDCKSELQSDLVIYRTSWVFFARNSAF